MSDEARSFSLTSVYSISNYTDAGVSRVRTYDAEGKLQQDFWVPTDLIIIFRGELERFRKKTQP